MSFSYPSQSFRHVLRDYVRVACASSYTHGENGFLRMTHFSPRASSPSLPLFLVFPSPNQFISFCWPCFEAEKSGQNNEKPGRGDELEREEKREKKKTWETEGEIPKVGGCEEKWGHFPRRRMFVAVLRRRRRIPTAGSRPHSRAPESTLCSSFYILHLRCIGVCWRHERTLSTSRVLQACQRVYALSTKHWPDTKEGLVRASFNFSPRSRWFRTWRMEQLGALARDFLGLLTLHR